ncbi:MAG: hypothetical protein NZ927_00610 [Candidatus Calescibacterium sp.]|nr:hypothetical protein [Candidatus Calescibacterium sp.]MCX7733870.1 hypothetical protein [bacterium]MDW8086651.1 hypothetical protein [Candidatus Calescibacterium sp.]
MWYLSLKILIYISIGLTIFSFLKPKNCNTKSLSAYISSAFLEAKSIAVKYGESTIHFQNEEIKIMSNKFEKKYRFDFKISAPATSKRACSNIAGTPQIKTNFKFSSRGLKDLSGTLYVSCDKDFLAFSVLSPTGGITTCIYNGKEWEDIN